MTGHAFSYYLSCHGGAFLMDVVCGCIGLLYALVAQRYRSLSLGHYCMWMELLQKACNSQTTTWWQCYILIAQMLSNGSTPGESELPFAASPSRFCWWLRLGCGPRWAQKDERCSVRLGLSGYSSICSRKSERKRCLSAYAVFRPKHSHDQPTDPQSLNLWINKQSWVCVSRCRPSDCDAVCCDAETYAKSH